MDTILADFPIGKIEIHNACMEREKQVLYLLKTLLSSRQKGIRQKILGFSSRTRFPPKKSREGLQFNGRR
jgi:hypothetical protein